MIDFVSELYYYAQIIPNLKEIINDCYSNKTRLVTIKWGEMVQLLEDFCRAISEKDLQLGQDIYNSLQAAVACLESGIVPNYNRMGDVLTMTLPLLYSAMSQFGTVDVEEGNYRIVSSRSGFFAMECIANHRFYHSMIDPMDEARHLAERIYSVKSMSYYLLGGGLGYLAYQLYCVSDCSADIYIFYNNRQLAEYAIDYGVLSWIPENKLNIIIREDEEELLNEYANTDESRGEISYFLLDDVVDSLSEKALDRIRVLNAYTFTKTLLGNIDSINVFRNIHNVKKMYYDSPLMNKYDEWFVVLAGPSLDNNLERLKEAQGKKGIICATTVLGKLLENGIVPSATTALDPHARTWGHLEGLSNHSVPLIINTVANWRFGELYSGERYLAPSISNSESVAYFDSKGIESLLLGSTVGVMAVRMAILLGAKTIKMVGLDLAYPNGRTHTSGTMDSGIIDTSNMPLVPCVAGGTVPTTQQFLVYINEINETILKNPNVSFINYSDMGANFRGSVWYKKYEK